MPSATSKFTDGTHVEEAAEYVAIVRKSCAAVSHLNAKSLSAAGRPVRTVPTGPPIGGGEAINPKLLGIGTVVLPC
jgi:hypothetical protein